MTTVAEPAEVVRVPHPDDMGTDTFCKHLNARHAHSIPEGFTILPDELDEYTEDCWRLWHERMHRLPVYDGSSFRVPDDGGHTHKPREDEE
jgi:hypothetical protein